MCGSKDFLKQEGVFVCQSCGIKYSVEDAKQLMTEGAAQIQGAVKVDKPSETETSFNRTHMLLEDGERKSTNEHCEKMLERAFLFLEDGNWENADIYLEKVLDFDPKSSQAYLGKLMLELRIRKKESLGSCSKCFDQSKNYQKILLFGSAPLKNEIESYLQSTKKHLANLEKNKNKERQQLKKVISILIFATLSCALIIYIIFQWSWSSKYKKAQALYEEGDFWQAYVNFSSLAEWEYSDSGAKAEKAYRELEKTAWVVIDNVTVKIPYDLKRNGYVTVSGNTITFSKEGLIPTIDMFLSWLDEPKGKTFYATAPFENQPGLKTFLVKDYSTLKTKYSSSNIWKTESVDLLFYGENTLEAIYRGKDGKCPQYITGTSSLLTATITNDGIDNVKFKKSTTTIIGQYYDSGTHDNPVTFQITVVIE